MALIDQLTSQITGIKIETAYLPEVSIANPFQPGPPNPYLSALKPKVTIELAGGAIRPVVLAPYGDPGASAPSVGGKLLAGAAAGLFFLALRLRQRRSRR